MYTLDTSHWHLLRILFLLAGTLVGGSLILAFVTGSLLWLFIAAVVSISQIVFAITGFCPAAIILDTLRIIPRD